MVCAVFSDIDSAGEVAATLNYCSGDRLQSLENILKVWCGFGNYTLALAGNPTIQGTAIDVDPESSHWYKGITD